LLKLSYFSKRCQKTKRWCNILNETVNHSVPPVVTSQIAHSHSMKLSHPLFEPDVIRINILNMIDVVHDALTCSNINRAVAAAAAH